MYSPLPQLPYYAVPRRWASVGETTPGDAAKNPAGVQPNWLSDNWGWVLAALVLVYFGWRQFAPGTSQGRGVYGFTGGRKRSRKSPRRGRKGRR